MGRNPYVMGPRPAGPRYLFYIDDVGDVFLINTRLNIFAVDKDHTIKLHDRGKLIIDSLQSYMVS